MNEIKIKARGEHPLLYRKFHPINNWEKLLELWQKAITYEELVGLLHAGFNIFPSHINKSDEIDRLVFYFNIADGYDGKINFKPSGEVQYFYRFGPDKDGYYPEKSYPEMRQMLAQKAFTMLCLNFFKIEGKFKGLEPWEIKDWWQNNIANNEILPIILNFFLNKKNNSELEVCNLSHRRGEWQHPEKHVLDFLLGLADFLFQWEKKEISNWEWELNKEESEQKEKGILEMQEFIYSARSLMIEILSWVRRLDVLEKWILKFDEASVLKLTEIALREELSKNLHPVNKDRKVLNIEEAIFAGSIAALLVKKYEIMSREKAKLYAIFESEIAIKNAQQKIAEINNK